MDSQGKRVHARLGGDTGPGLDTGNVLAPHGIALNSKGDIYLGEVGVTDWKTSFPDTPMPKVVRCLQKLERVSGRPGLSERKPGDRGPGFSPRSTRATRPPLQRTSPGRRARRKRGLEQIAAGRRFPVQHFPGGEHAGNPDHESRRVR